MYKRQGYDELVDSIRTEADLAKRAEMMHQAEDMLMDTWCVIPVSYTHLDVYKRQVSDTDYLKLIARYRANPCEKTEKLLSRHLAMSLIHICRYGLIGMM